MVTTFSRGVPVEIMVSGCRSVELLPASGDCRCARVPACINQRTRHRVPFIAESPGRPSCSRARRAAVSCEPGGRRRSNLLSICT